MCLGVPGYTRIQLVSGAVRNFANIDGFQHPRDVPETHPTAKRPTSSGMGNHTQLLYSICRLESAFELNRRATTDSKARSVVVFVANYPAAQRPPLPQRLTMCDTALCNAMALCGHCFDEALKAGDSTKKRKKTGGRKRTLFLSPADKLKHDNKIKLGSSRRKRAKVKAGNVTF